MYIYDMQCYVHVDAFLGILKQQLQIIHVFLHTQRYIQNLRRGFGMDTHTHTHTHTHQLTCTQRPWYGHTHTHTHTHTLTQRPWYGHS